MIDGGAKATNLNQIAASGMPTPAAHCACLAPSFTGVRHGIRFAT
jgi:hypothetical protein